MEIEMQEPPSFENVRVLCIGDVMLDRFILGDVRRISPESPVPIIQIGTTNSVPGGAANVARNIAALGGNCTIVGVIGDDSTGVELSALIGYGEHVTPILIKDNDRATIEKIRFVAQGHHLLRADRETAGNISEEAEEAINHAVDRLIGEHDVLVLSDYAKGVLTDTVIANAISCAQRAGIPVVVDPKSRHLARYAGACVITPNANEVTQVTGMEVVSDASAAAAALEAIAVANVDAILVTRSEQGMTLVTRDGKVMHTAASAREVFDVVGAGDTVVATLSLCLGGGAALNEAVRIANAAAGVVVGKRGTATLNRSELMGEISRLSHGASRLSKPKIVTVDHALSIIQQWKCEGLRVGFIDGCFDIIHVGHIKILEFGRGQCDRLIVGVNSDVSVSRLKGSSRPINAQEDRAQIIAAFPFVDTVVVFDEETSNDLISRLGPDVLIKGYDRQVEQVDGHDVAKRGDGKVVLFDLIPGRSTSNVISRSSQILETSK